jgi:hypothetical protein
MILAAMNHFTTVLIAYSMFFKKCFIWNCTEVSKPKA